MFTRLLANANDAWEFPSMGKMYEVHCLPVWGGGQSCFAMNSLCFNQM